MNILILVVFVYMRDKAQSGTSLECEPIQKTAKVEYHVQSLGAYFAACDMIRLTVCRIFGWYPVLKVAVLRYTYY